MKVRGLALYCDGSTAFVTLAGLADYQAVVKGDIEAIGLPDGSTMWSNEDGMAMLPDEPNIFATRIAHLGSPDTLIGGGVVLGPVLLTGPMDQEGNDSDVTEAAIALAATVLWPRRVAPLPDARPLPTLVQNCTHPGEPISRHGDDFCPDCGANLSELPTPVQNQRRFLATINTPGYLPEADVDDPAIFDSAREAWDYLASERKRDEDDFAEDERGYSGVVNTLEMLAEGNFDPAFGVGSDGTGTVSGGTVGYDGDHDLGRAYSVTDVTNENEED